ncbi:MAG TPA: hypothetical protein VIK52_05905 [Opitutaceae bacterium]
MLPTTEGPGCLSVILGPAEHFTLDVGLPVLAGESTEIIFKDVRDCGISGSFVLGRSEEWLIGGATAPVADDLEGAAGRLYRELLEASAGMHLARIWNYVPAINGAGPLGVENYRHFCKGRSIAFETRFGRSFRQFLPSASAVGCRPGALTVIFAASPRAPRHIENPLQVPAYDYPMLHGPRPPSFARATVVETGAGSTVFISGTSAIRGHSTVSPRNTGEQLECTLENLGEVSRACGIGSDLGATRACRRHFKVYLRHAEDLAMVTPFLDERLFRPGDSVSYLKAGICRQALNVEIEATLWEI